MGFVPSQIILLFWDSIVIKFEHNLPVKIYNILLHFAKERSFSYGKYGGRHWRFSKYFPGDNPAFTRFYEHQLFVKIKYSKQFSFCSFFKDKDYPAMAVFDSKTSRHSTQFLKINGKYDSGLEA